MSKKNAAKIEVIPPFMTAHKDPKTGKYDKFEGFGKDFVGSVLKDARTIGEWKNKTSEKQEEAINLAIGYTAYKQAGGKGLPHFVHTYLDATCPIEYGAEGTDTRKIINSHTVFNGVRYMIEQIAKPVLTGQTKEQKLLDAGVNPKDKDKVKAYTSAQRTTAENTFQGNVVDAVLEIIEFGATDTSITTLVSTYPGTVEKEIDEHGNPILKKRGKDLVAKIRAATDQYYIEKAGISLAPPSVVPQAMTTKNQKKGKK